MGFNDVVDLIVVGGGCVLVVVACGGDGGGFSCGDNDDVCWFLRSLGVVFLPW